MSRVEMGVSARIVRELEPAIAATRSLAMLLELGVISLEQPEELLNLLESHAKVLRIDRLYVGSDDGRFFMVAMQPNGTCRRRVVLPAEDVQFWSWLDAEGTVQREDEPISFDPRTRAWYTLASTRGEIWTDVYRFQSDNQPGITAAAPVSAPGSGCEHCVIGADVTLSELSDFLAQLEVSSNGFAFILDKEARLIAHPDQSLVLDKNYEPEKSPRANDPLVRVAVARMRMRGEAEPMGGVSPSTLTNGRDSVSTSGKRIQVTETIDSNRWHLSILPLTAGPDMPPFTVGVAVPESDFLGTLQRTRMISMIIAVLAIAVGVLLALAFSRGIARPIVHLERSMRRVGSFDLDVDTKIDTVYVELEHMMESFERMVGGLRSFSRYVPRDLVRDLMASGRQAELGAEERELSMCFSDIAGFTSLCETMEPQALIAQLGEYFETAVSCIKAQGGTIDKFIGDALMALWNAPRANPHHALGAASGAVDMLHALDRLNERWRAEGLPELPTRIGISTDTVVVGNVGSSHRLTYTALGDGVNLTARLEAANKHYSTRILASEALVSRLPAGFIAVQPLDVLVVKGKAKNVRIFEVLGRREHISSERLEGAEIYTEAFDLYLARRFEEATRRFEEVIARLPSYRPAELLFDRCRLFSTEPPPEDWDGSFVLDEK